MADLNKAAEAAAGPFARPIATSAFALRLLRRDTKRAAQIATKEQKAQKKKKKREICFF